MVCGGCNRSVDWFSINRVDVLHKVKVKCYDNVVVFYW